MSTMIKMQVIGNLGKDCVVNQVNGKNVINFTVAHTEKYRDSQGKNQGLGIDPPDIPEPDIPA